MIIMRLLKFVIILLILTSGIQCDADSSEPNLSLQEKTLKEAIKEEPNDPDLYFELGMVYESQNKYGKAEEVLKKCLALNPHHAKAHNLLGHVYEELGDYASSIEHYQRAIESDGTFMEPYIMLSGLYRVMYLKSPNEDYIDKQLKVLQMALGKCDIRRDRQRCITILNNLCVLLLEEKINYSDSVSDTNMYKVIEYAKRGIELLRDEDELKEYAIYRTENGRRIHLDRGLLYYHLGDAYRELNNVSEALGAYYEALSEFQQIDDRHWINRIQDDIKMTREG
jgi:tetratricopeptide (TPR) repeat protein